MCKYWFNAINIKIYGLRLVHQVELTPVTITNKKDRYDLHQIDWVHRFRATVPYHKWLLREHVHWHFLCCVCPLSRWLTGRPSCCSPRPTLWRSWASSSAPPSRSPTPSSCSRAQTRDSSDWGAGAEPPIFMCQIHFIAGKRPWPLFHVFGVLYPSERKGGGVVMVHVAWGGIKEGLEEEGKVGNTYIFGEKWRKDDRQKLVCGVDRIGLRQVSGGDSQRFSSLVVFQLLRLTHYQSWIITKPPNITWTSQSPASGCTSADVAQTSCRLSQPIWRH